ncbi:glutathione S-transferase family protein [Sandaracinobacter neustonicus]|uniref:Glutathione S-transferase family protein n=1 Tax=Sandaracinobacter neustonicus TaxID=1715348 RepID=A0A501XQA6_9SPHN|nr:glutathione S-transferase family protein [Sandaracinobacter neustonicus]TPE62287.1 glutathione S-transferase family protein [Sandaracinobacter neustonicus]
MLILHHYPASPWSEVLRLALGLKGLDYGAVEVPSLRPKPELELLTGGYVRTPVLQSGADIFCGTAAAIDALEMLHPSPSLFPEPLRHGHRLLAELAQGSVFVAAAGAAMGELPTTGLEAFWADRERRFGLKPDAFRALAPHLAAQFAAHLANLEAALSDGRAFLGGDTPGHGDLAHYQLLWFQKPRLGGDLSPLLANRPHLGAWALRVADIGHGRPTPITAAEAIAAASSSEPRVRGIVAADSGFQAGQTVLVSQEGSTDAAVEGSLAVLTDRRITLLRDTPETGPVALHFPRLGQIVRGA